MSNFHNGVQLASGTAVATSSWTSVQTPFVYAPGEMVVVTTPIYDGDQSVVTRVRNAEGDRFEIRAEALDGAPITQPIAASWISVRAGVYNIDNGAVRLEAQRVDAIDVDGAENGWNGEQYTYLQSYQNPVVIGQVMSANARWSVFWARGASRFAPPSPTDCYVGRHVGEDPSPGRVIEQLGVVVFEQQEVELNNIKIRPLILSASGRNFPPVESRFSDFSHTNLVCASTGMFNTDGCWPVRVETPGEPYDGLIRMRLEEDQLRDIERDHFSESIATVLIDSTNDASRFVAQSGFGAQIPELRSVAARGYAGWIDDQMSLPISRTTPYMDELIAIEQPYGGANAYGTQEQQNELRDSFPFLFTFADQGIPDTLNFSTVWLRNLLTESDQLRQRVTWSLSQILVTSGRSSQLRDGGASLADYYDTLATHAFGNYRNMLRDVSVHPAMSYYLSSLGNQKPDPSNNQQPDENYAREIMQLFSIGLWELNNDGSQKLDGAGQPIPTYSNTDITNIARVFTGLWYADRPFGVEGNIRINQGVNRLPLEVFVEHHDTGSKRVFDGKPWELNLSGAEDGMTEIGRVVQALFEHPNTPPFICRRMIQFLVTSNPKPAYVERIANVFINNGSGVRGDLGAVVRAILLDRDARSYFPDDPTYGKLLEPMVRLARLVRTFAAGTEPTAPTDVDDMQFWRFKTEVDAFAQWPMYSPSVFNFFEPDYSHGGPIRDQGLLSPELQIHTPVTSVTFPNELATIIDARLQTHRPELTPLFKLNTTDEMEHAYGDGSKLIDRLDTMLAWGQLSDETRDLLLQNFAEFPAPTSLSGENAQRRIKLAAWIMMVSPDTAVLR